ncbi:MAG: hypothetical protein ACREDM_14455 [Methylocella sp.]
MPPIAVRGSTNGKSYFDIVIVGIVGCGDRALVTVIAVGSALGLF